MAQLAVVAPYLSAASTVVSSYASIKQGMDQKSASESVARQRERDANDAQVEAQQVAARERKKSKYLRSRALAVAGASGGGVSDPTISNILTGLDVEGEMSALNALHNGDTTAAGYRAGAATARREGRAAMSAGLFGGVGKALTGFGEFAEDNPSFFKKYGGDRAQRIGVGTGYSDFDEENPFWKGSDWGRKISERGLS